MSGLQPASYPRVFDGGASQRVDTGDGEVRKGGADPAKAAHDLEAFFLRQMLAEVRPEGGMLDGGFAGSTFKEMLDGALADRMADSGGIGLAALIQPELERAAAREGGSPALERSAAPLAASHARAASAYRAQSGFTLCDDPGFPAPSLRALPVDGERSSPFGRRVDPLEGDVRGHAGVDIAAPEGAPVRSAGDGVVVRSGRAGGYGNLVVVDHGGGLTTRYGHLSRIDVADGQRVAAGSAIGAVGQTGRATGPHLHFEVRRNGEAVDPAREAPLPPLPATAEKKEAPPLNPGQMRPNRQAGGR